LNSPDDQSGPGVEKDERGVGGRIGKKKVFSRLCQARSIPIATKESKRASEQEKNFKSRCPTFESGPSYLKKKN